MPVPIPAWGRVKQIALGDEHACALDVNGTVRCAGDNLRGQLGVHEWDPDSH